MGSMSEEIGDTIVQSVQNGCGTARPFVCKDPNLTYKQQNRTWKSVSSWTSQPICKHKMFDVFCLLELQMPTPFSHSHGGGGFKKTKCCHPYLGKIPMLTIFSSKALVQPPPGRIVHSSWRGPLFHYHGMFFEEVIGRSVTSMANRVTKSAEDPDILHRKKSKRFRLTLDADLMRNVLSPHCWHHNHLI